MQKLLHGIHHITAVSSDAQANLDFYSGVLGLRLVKLTVNFDDPTMYHLYFGDKTGSPGSLLTFFPITGAQRGKVGPGQVSAIAFSIPPESIEFWANRLSRHGVAFDGPFQRFGQEVITAYDTDGLPVELVADAQPNPLTWTTATVPAQHSIKRFHSATLHVNKADSTARLLELMGFTKSDSEENRARFMTSDGQTTQFADLLSSPDSSRGIPGAGTVHHIAWRCLDSDQEAWREKIADNGFTPTSIIDRKYFHSVYFRERGGILFEIATDSPGMMIDESESTLGTHLKLPPWHEDKRTTIEQRLPALRTRTSPVSPKP